MINDCTAGTTFNRKYLVRCCIVVVNNSLVMVALSTLQLRIIQIVLKFVAGRPNRPVVRIFKKSRGHGEGEVGEKNKEAQKTNGVWVWVDGFASGQHCRVQHRLSCRWLGLKRNVLAKLETVAINNFSGTCTTLVGLFSPEESVIVAFVYSQETPFVGQPVLPTTTVESRVL